MTRLEYDVYKLKRDIKYLMCCSSPIPDPGGNGTDIIVETLDTDSDTYQSNSLIGAEVQMSVDVNGVHMYPTFDSTTGTLDNTAGGGFGTGILTIIYTKAGGSGTVDLQSVLNAGNTAEGKLINLTSEGLSIDINPTTGSINLVDDSGLSTNISSGNGLRVINDTSSNTAIYLGDKIIHNNVSYLLPTAVSGTGDKHLATEEWVLDSSTLQTVAEAGSTSNIPLSAPAFNIYDETTDDTYGGTRVDGTQGVLDLFNRTPGTGTSVTIAGATSIGAGGGSSRWNHQDEGLVDTASRQWVGQRAIGGAITLAGGVYSTTITGLPDTIAYPVCSAENSDATQLMANAGYVARIKVTSPGEITIFTELPGTGMEIFNWNAVY